MRFGLVDLLGGGLVRFGFAVHVAEQRWKLPRNCNTVMSVALMGNMRPMSEAPV